VGEICLVIWETVLCHDILYVSMAYLTEEKETVLRKQANDIRISIVEMLKEAKSGHTAGPLGMADVFTALYFHIAHHDPQNPEMDNRDRIILSNGHIVPVRYATMAHAGYFPIEELMTLRKLGSRLQGHPERTRLPGLENTSGPLGSGLSQSAGIAYAARMDGKKFRTFCLMSDGELNAGNTWEGAMFAGKNKLSNLTAIIDRNNIQINGMTEDVMPLEPLADKWESFGWHVMEIDGHNMEEIVDACEKARAIVEKPTVIIARTIPGKGIPEIEFDYRWHGAPPGKGPGDIPKEEQSAVFLKRLRTLGGEIEAGHSE
jgi:transketolase